MILEYCGSKVVFFLPSEMKVLNGPYIQELLEAVLLPASLPIIKILGHSKFDTLETREITLLAFLQKLLPSKEPTAAKPLSWSNGIVPLMIT